MLDRSAAIKIRQFDWRLVHTRGRGNRGESQLWRAPFSLSPTLMSHSSSLFRSISCTLWVRKKKKNRFVQLYLASKLRLRLVISSEIETTTTTTTTENRDNTLSCIANFFFFFAFFLKYSFMEQIGVVFSEICLLYYDFF